MQAACPVRSDEQLQLYKIFVTCAAYESPPPLFPSVNLFPFLSPCPAPPRDAALSLLMASEGDD